MSNQAVGNVYQTIMEEVINASRVDFEEGGVDESVLEELRLGWQAKLSQLDVAPFPWDPKPEPVPAAAAAPPAAPAPVPTAALPPPQPQYSQAQLTPQLPVGGIALPNGPGLTAVKQEPTIKQEPGVKHEAGQPNASILAGRTNEARLRAQQNLQAQYGPRAAGSISAIQAGIGQQGPKPPPQVTPIAPPQYGRPAAQQQQLQNGQPSVHTAQTDGANDAEEVDYEGIIMQRAADGTLKEMGRVDIDRALHAQIAARAKAMEGGGLMLPLEEATRHPTALSSHRRHHTTVDGYDGGLDDEEDDEDAINSDLDDPDEREEDEDGEDDGTLQHVMLCMYDKVQRVKNKWKCILKDGVLTVNGKEYVFHKATGEYEW